MQFLQIAFLLGLFQRIGCVPLPAYMLKLSFVTVKIQKVMHKNTHGRGLKFRLGLENFSCRGLGLDTAGLGLGHASKTLLPNSAKVLHQVLSKTW